MSLTISFAVLFAALLHASWNAMIKGGGDVLLDTSVIVTGAGLVALPFLFVVPIPAAASWPYIAASVAIHIAYYYLMINAYRSGDLSLVYPLMRGVAPLLTGVLGIVTLREMPGAMNWVGMLLISAGVVALALRSVHHSPSGRAVSFALMNALVIAIYTIVDGTGARLAGDAWAYIVWLFVLDAIPFTAYMLLRHRSRLHRRAGPSPDAGARRRIAVGRRVRDLGVGDDKGAGGAGGFAARNVGAVRDADRGTPAAREADAAPMGGSHRRRAGRGGPEGCVTEGCLTLRRPCAPRAGPPAVCPCPSAFPLPR